MSDFFTSTSLLTRDGSHPNPMFDYLTGFVPRRLKDLFRWCEYLYYNSTHIFAALRKFAEYPITNLTYDTENEALKRQYKTLLEKNLKILPSLILAGTDYLIYGNHFTSIYVPFVRYLQCKGCKALTNIKWVDYKFSLKNMDFQFTCPQCSKASSAIVVDKPIPFPAKINIIRWDPKLIDIDYNPITGESVYYYNIPEELRYKVERGNKHLIDTMPWEFLKALSKSNSTHIFKFDENQIYHMKIHAPSGIDAMWGFPPITSTLKQFFFAAVLRRANEAIALEHILPFRIVFPDTRSSVGDPAAMMNMGKWINETKTNWKKFRMDPLHVQFAPVPIGVANVGGQGKGLMVSAEIQDVENNIIAALGVPREFLYGGLSYTGSEITLKMLENQLLTFTSQLNALLQWTADKCGDFLGWEKIPIRLSEFTLAEDIQKKTLSIQLADRGKLSWSTVAEMFGWDPEVERDRRVSEAVDEARVQIEIQQKISKFQNSLAAQAQAGTPPSDKILADADAIVQQIVDIPTGDRRSQLEQLQQSDYVMYAVVMSRLKELRRQSREGVA